MIRRLLALPALLLAFSTPAAIRPERLEPDAFHPLPRWRAHGLPVWGVALSGGAAWGPAQVGFLRAAEQDGLVPDRIAATSAGALHGSLIATGVPPSRVERLLRRDGFAVSPFRAPAPGTTADPGDPLDPARAPFLFGRDGAGDPLPWRGLVPDHPVLSALTRWLAWGEARAGGDFDALAIPFRAVCTDLLSGEKYAPAAGSLVTAVRGSIGLPVFRPVAENGRLLADGGLVEFVPVPTAREMGSEVVVSVRLSRRGEVVEPVTRVGGLASVVFRTFDVATSVPRRGGAAGADVAVDLMVGDLPFDDFTGHLDELLRAGEETWARVQGEVWAALTRGSPTLRVERIEGGEEIAARLGLPAEVPVRRLEAELARLLNRGGLEDAWLEDAGNGVLALRSVAEPPVTVAVAGTVMLAVEPGPRPLSAALAEMQDRVLDLRRDGWLALGIDRVERAGDRASVVVDEGRIVAVEGAPLPELVGRPARQDEIEEALGRLERRGLLLEPRIDRLVPAEGGYVLRVAAAPERAWEAAGTGGLGDGLGPTAWVRVARGPWEARLAAGREAVVAGAEWRRERPRGPVPVARLVLAHLEQPVYGPTFRKDDWVDEDLAALAAGARWGPFEAALVGRRTEGATDLALDAGTRGTRGGVSWTAGLSLPVAGEDRAPLAVGDAAWHRPFASERWAVDLAVRASEAFGDDPVPLERRPEAGAWWEAPPLGPGQGRDPEVRRGSLHLVRRIRPVGPASLALGATVSSWKAGQRSGSGAAVYAQVRIGGLGPATLAFLDGDEAGDRLVLTFAPERVPWPGVLASLPGR